MGWLVRHVYMPCMRAGVGRSAGMVIVFAVSAVMHEVAVSVPCGRMSLWAFGGMMGQIPLVQLTNYLAKRFKDRPSFKRIGNLIFWVSFCILGQPMCVLLYYLDA